MKTPANPFTIHVIDAHDVVPYIAAPRPLIVNRLRPYITNALTRTGRGLVQTSRVAVFVVTELSRMIVGIGIGLVKGVRVFYYALLVMLEFLFVKIPVFIVGLIVLIMAIGFGYGIVDALYRGFHHLPLH
jgi:hypothetical protein